MAVRFEDLLHLAIVCKKYLILSANHGLLIATLFRRIVIISNSVNRLDGITNGNMHPCCRCNCNTSGHSQVSGVEDVACDSART